MGSDGDFVPSYGGRSPERFAAGFLDAFMTQAAARIVLKQLEGLAPSSSLALGEVDLDGGRTTQRAGDHYTILKEYLEDEACRDGRQWLKGLMQKDHLLGVRVAEARVAYATEGFQWEVLQGMVPAQMHEDNGEVMREMMMMSSIDDGITE
eukprot:gene19600-23441_t